MIHDPAHKGEVLRDYLGGLTIADVAKRLGVTRAHLSRILNGHASVTANMSLRLAAASGTSPDFWAKMQLNYDLCRARKKKLPKVKPFPQIAVSA